jgi:lipopolysaccharide transport system ATP-binding protein
MMPDTVISVENLSKCYLIGHQAARGKGYVTLRETLAHQVRSFVRDTVRLARGNQIVQGDKVEEFWALKNVSFEVKKGDVIGIVGRNGAGKSTLLKILSQITDPTVGRAWIDGRVASLLEVGTGFHPELTGRENIFLNGAVLGMSKAEVKSRFDEIIAFAEVEQFLDTPIKRYSSGMYVRLAFAVAAHLEPEILIVDEVLSVGDAQFQKKCLGKINDVAKAGRTVLFVSHNIVAVRSLCSRALLLDKGKIVLDGEVDEVAERYFGDSSSARGLIEWDSPANAPGDSDVRLKSISVACDGMDTGLVDIEKDFVVTVEYWVLRECSIILSFHLNNGRGETIISSTNQSSISATYDPFAERPCPPGLYRTSCTYPGRLFNDGDFTITAFIVNKVGAGNHTYVVETLKFKIIDTGFMREEYQGPWLGSLRMKLPWSTKVIAAESSRRHEFSSFD